MGRARKCNLFKQK